MHEAKKRFGQNFLTDKNLLQKIVRDSFIIDDVIEVGPGLGALTNYIVKASKKVVAYEIDGSLKDVLDVLENQNKNLTVVYGDFLNVDLAEEKKKRKLSNSTCLIGNLPYYITSPILFKFIETNYIKSATIMVQKEVGERILAKENSKQYNALSVIIQFQSSVKRIVNVDKTMFTPVPKVDSVVLSITKNDKFDETFKARLIRFVKLAFEQKRKTLVNNLSDGYKIPKDKVIDFLKKANLDERVRAEQISVDKFIEIVKEFKLDK